MNVNTAQELQREVEELRARLEDARRLAVYYATNGITPLEGSVRECVSRILAHPIGTAQDDDADDVIDNECYTHMPPAHPAPAPATCDAFLNRSSGFRCNLPMGHPGMHRGWQSTWDDDTEGARPSSAVKP